MWSVAVRRLALGVLDLAVRDACAGSLEAREFLAGPDFTVWAFVLGVPPQVLRRAAREVDREGFPIWPQLAAEASAALATCRLVPRGRGNGITEPPTAPAPPGSIVWQVRPFP